MKRRAWSIFSFTHLELVGGQAQRTIFIIGQLQGQEVYLSLRYTIFPSLPHLNS